MNNDAMLYAAVRRFCAQLDGKLFSYRVYRPNMWTALLFVQSVGTGHRVSVCFDTLAKEIDFVHFDERFACPLDEAEELARQLLVQLGQSYYFCAADGRQDRAPEAKFTAADERTLAAAAGAFWNKDEERPACIDVTDFLGTVHKKLVYDAQKAAYVLAEGT